MANSIKCNVLNYKKLQSGQSLLIVVLVLVVALTVGLSVAVRSTTNLRTSVESDSSEKAFSAAEAGIEKSLQSNNSAPLTTLSNNASFQTTVADLAGSGFNLNNGSTVLKDDSVDLWLSTYPDYTNPWSGSLSINWGSMSDTCSPIESNNTQAALEVVLITGTSGSPKTTSYLLDPCSSRAASNNFEYVTTAGDTIDGKTYARKKTITITSGLIVRIIPLYAPSFVGAQNAPADPVLPSQGSIITAVGTSENTKRKIVSFRGHPKLPTELFPFVFFSPK
jgi:hypothetical protein